ncbi:hypothetical protein CVT26_000404 [Gymnopilus dilepis]|uniref:F-box domain-containing protein n=1 Tax=Gymnopilus dilepis TaxID=231916 RepID=A0A409VHT1_9AGAR|nr:hypothetical protein CVT26_000404 [Gymnopilus dilepis]
MAYSPIEGSSYLIEGEFWDRMNKHQTAIHQWLLRSSPRPLSISIYIPQSLELKGLFEVADGGDVGYLGYFVLLASVFPRLSVLDASFPPGDVSQFFAFITPEELPILRRLRLTFYSHYMRPYTTSKSHHERWKSTRLLKATNLRQLELIYFPYTIPNYMEVQWYNLTHLHIMFGEPDWQNNGFTLHEAHGVLSLCYHLVKLAMKVIGDNSAISPVGSVRLPFLQSIALIDAAVNLSTLIDCIEVPQLTLIAYESFHGPSDYFRSPLTLLLSKNNMRTEELTTNIEHLSLLNLYWLFYYSPNLTHFHHTSSQQWVHRLRATHLDLPLNFERAFIEFLIPDSEGRCSLPSLTHLHITGANVEIINDTLIARIVKGRRERRQHSARALKHVRIDAEGYVDYARISGQLETWRHGYATNASRRQLVVPPTGSSGPGGDFKECKANVEFFYPASSNTNMPSPPELGRGKFEVGRDVDSSRQWGWKLHPYPRQVPDL